MADILKNFAISAVATAPSPADSGTSLVVTAGHGSRFPTPPFYATVCPANTVPTPANAEIVRVTGVSTDTLTITRAAESTTARSIVVGDQIFQALTAAYFVQPLVVTGGTVTASTPVLDATQTWNNAAVAFSGIKLNVTNTNSDAASALLNLQVGGSTVFSVDRNGSATSAYLLTANGHIISNTGWCFIHHDGAFSWGLGQTNLFRDGAHNIIGQRTDTNAQTFRVYRTWTDGSNYERISLKSSAGIMEVAAETAGTGTDDLDLQLTSAGAGLVRFGTHSGIGGETVTGFITIKDAGGTTRKLAVVA